MNARRERLLVGLLLAAFLVMAASFSLMPLLEGEEEAGHYRYIRTLVEDGTLPNALQQPGRQQHQAPLYYLLAAPVSALVDPLPFHEDDLIFNPFSHYDITAPGNDNKVQYLHFRTEAFPYSADPTALAVHLIRLISCLLGAGTLLACYALFRRLWPDRADLRLAATGFVAGMPRFVQVSGMVNNDGLLWLLATLALLLAVIQLQDGPTPRRAILLGLVLGAALLTKINAAFLVFPIGAAVLIDPRRAWRSAILTLLVVAAVAGWWFVRNWSLYGDITGMNTLFDVTQVGESIGGSGFEPGVGLSHLSFAYATFWARYADGRVAVALVFYTLYDLLTAGILAGAGLWIGRALARIRRGEVAAFRIKQGAVIAVYGITWLLALGYYASRAWNGAQGRYLMIAVAVWGLLFALALESFTPRRFKLPAALVLVGLWIGLTAAGLYGDFLPAYRVSPLPDRVDVPREVHYGDAATLIGLSGGTLRARPGDTTALSLYWRADSTPADELVVHITTVGAEVVRRDSYPGTGLLPATDWQPGQTWAEHYVIHIPADAPPQTSYPLLVTLYDPARDADLPATDGQGNPITPLVGRVGINGPAVAGGDPAYRLGESIGLRAAPVLTRVEGGLRACLEWLALGAPDEDYQIFLHVLDERGAIVAQVDGAPRGGTYPTGVWAAGEIVPDCLTLPLDGEPAGAPDTGWTGRLGLYRLPDVTRLPATGPDGTRLPDDAIPLAVE